MGVVVYSRLPMSVLEGRGPTSPGCATRDGPAGPSLVYALHVPRPWLTDVGGYQATVAEHHDLPGSDHRGVTATVGPCVDSAP